jgi:hypothetical protein
MSAMGKHCAAENLRFVVEPVSFGHEDLGDQMIMY